MRPSIYISSISIKKYKCEKPSEDQKTAMGGKSTFTQILYFSLILRYSTWVFPHDATLYFKWTTFQNENIVLSTPVQMYFFSFSYFSGEDLTQWIIYIIYIAFKIQHIVKDETSSFQPFCLLISLTSQKQCVVRLTFQMSMSC